MKLALLKDDLGDVRVGAVIGGTINVARGSLHPGDIGSWIATVETACTDGVGAWAEQLALQDTPLAVPFARPGKIVAIGLNYVDHAVEGGMKIPERPLIFSKFTTALTAQGQPITWDRSVTRGVDFEAELAVVIGRAASNVTVEHALDHVLGYTCLNDVSARDLQFVDEQWIRGKSLDTFCPAGPWLVTADEIPDPQALRVSCTVSGEVLQDASTADMIFGVAELISYCSRHFTLEPGDVIATGTPPGVGWFRTPRRCLEHGDVVDVTISGIGTLSNPCIEHNSDEGNPQR